VLLRGVAIPDQRLEAGAVEETRSSPAERVSVVAALFMVPAAPRCCLEEDARRA
jgi:hypothetical protein